MIISHKHRYLFIQLPHTGSSSIAKELRKNYDGVPVHRKHTTYHRFLKTATEDEKTYFTFSGIRNPINEVISIYFKLKTNHEGYDNPDFFVENGGFVTKRMRKRFFFVQDEKTDFERYFKKYFKLPYDNWSRLDHRNLNFVMRLENLQDDFSEVLRRINIRQVRPLPRYNVTRKKKKSAAELFPPKLRAQAEWVFGPFLQDWHYDLPFSNTPPVVTPSCRRLYEVCGALRTLYWRSR